MTWSRLEDIDCQKWLLFSMEGRDGVAAGGRLEWDGLGEEKSSEENDKMSMSVFERLLNGESCDIRDAQYRKEVHGEIDRCRRLGWRLNNIDPGDREGVMALERELLNGDLKEGTFLTPPFQIDCANCVHLGKDVFANHGLTMMSLGTITIEDGVMIGPEVGFFTVNHQPGNIRVIWTGRIRIGKNAWIGARVSILPGVTIGENVIVGTGAVVTRDIPDNCVAVGVPARVVKRI